MLLVTGFAVLTLSSVTASAQLSTDTTNQVQDTQDQGQQYGQQYGQQQGQSQQYCTAENRCPTPSALGRDIDISPQPDTTTGLANNPYSRQQQGRNSNTTTNNNQRLSELEARPPQPSEFQQMVAASTGRMLPIFGASMFTQVPSTFAPVDNIPVAPDYVIGPGDELRVQIWGQINQHGTFAVDRTGSIALPQVGTVHVAGLQFAQLADFLKSQLARVYRNFDLNVNLGELRSIQVFVVGRARKPGSYTISSLSTLLNALFESGGPTPQGSLRDIQVRRNGETVTHFDLYDLLLHGDKSKDVRLEPGDVIFIPDVGPQVAITGSVNTPAVYELRGETTVTQALALAGGLTNTAAVGKLRVERIPDRVQRTVVEVGLDAAGATAAHDGDIITAESIVGRFKDAITLRGNVANPGRYQWQVGMHIADLIPNRDMLVTRDYYQRLLELGRPTVPAQVQTQGQWQGQTLRPTMQPGSEGVLGIRNGQTQALTPTQGSNQPQSQNPSGQIEQNPLQRNGTTGTSGGGNSAGGALTDSNNTFEAKNDVILPAPDIDWEYAVIERQSSTDLTTSLLPFNLSKAVIDRDPAQNLELLPGDVVTIFSKADIRVPSAQQTKIVRLEGEFAGAGVWSVKPGETLRDLVARAGGLTPDADLFASEFTRDSVRRLQKQRLDAYADELESQISANATANAASALTAQDVAAATSTANESRAVLARLRAAQPTGRIVLPLKPDSAGLAVLPEIALEDGDRFVVPRVPSTVAVEGQVYNANAFLYVKSRRVKDYLRLAGGPDRIGDSKREFVLRADGSVVSKQAGGFAERAIFADHDFEDVVLYPGDTIIVPPIIQKSAVLRNLSNIGTIVEGFGLGAAAIQVLK